MYAPKGKFLSFIVDKWRWNQVEKFDFELSASERESEKEIWFIAKKKIITLSLTCMIELINSSEWLSKLEAFSGNSRSNSHRTYYERATRFHARGEKNAP